MFKLGGLLILVAIAALGFMLAPLFLQDKTPVLNVMQPIFCEPGDKLTVEVITSHYRPGETSVTGDYNCIRPNGTTYNVTDKSFIVGAAAFVVPFLIGLFLMIGAWNRSVRGVIPAGTVEINTGGSFSPFTPTTPYMNPQSPSSGYSTGTGANPQGNTELTNRLKQLRDAYDAGMISNEEYERTRADLLKDFSNAD
jgi:hypothetical protein